MHDSEKRNKEVHYVWRKLVWTSFAFGFVSKPVPSRRLRSSFWQKQGSSEVLQACSTQLTLSNPQASAPKVEGLSSPCVTATRFDLQQMESDRSFFIAFHFIEEKIRSPLHLRRWDVRRFSSFLRALSYRGYRGKVSSSCSHPSSCQNPRRSMASRASPIFTASLSCSPKIRFLSFSCLFFARFRLMEKSRFPSVNLSLILRFCFGVHHIRGHTPFFSPPLFSFLLCFGSLRYVCAISDHPLLLILRSSSGLEGLHRARHGLDEEVVDCIGLLGIHEVIELRRVLLKRVLGSAFHFRPFPSSRPGRIHGQC